MNKILIDTNVFLYDLDKSSLHHKKANEILSSGMELATTSKNISEFFAVTSKVRADVFSVWNYFQEIKNNVEILFPSFKSLEIFEQMIQRYHPVGNKVFDIEIVSILLTHQLEVIATFNRKDFSDIAEVVLL